MVQISHIQGPKLRKPPSSSSVFVLSLRVSFIFYWLKWAFFLITPELAFASCTKFGFINLAITIGLDHLSSSFAETPSISG